MNLESSKSTKGLAIYDLFGYHASRVSVSAAILDFEKCSRVNSIYPTDYVHGIFRTSKSVEKKTMSIKSGFSLKITFGCLTTMPGLEAPLPTFTFHHLLTNLILKTASFMPQIKKLFLIICTTFVILIFVWMAY